MDRWIDKNSEEAERLDCLNHIAEIKNWWNQTVEKRTALLRALRTDVIRTENLNGWIETLQKETAEPNIITKKVIWLEHFQLYNPLARECQKLYQESSLSLLKYHWENEAEIQDLGLKAGESGQLSHAHESLFKILNTITKYAYLEKMNGKGLAPLCDFKKALLADQAQSFKVFREFQKEIFENWADYGRKIEVHQGDCPKIAFFALFRYVPKSLIGRISMGYFMEVLSESNKREEAVKSFDKLWAMKSYISGLADNLRNEVSKALRDINDSFIRAGGGKHERHKPLREALSKLVEDHGFKKKKDFIEFIRKKIAKAKAEAEKERRPIDDELLIDDIPCTDGDIQIFLKKDPVKRGYEKRVFYSVDGDPKIEGVSYRGLSDLRDPSGSEILPKRPYRKNKSATN